MKQNRNRKSYVMLKHFATLGLSGLFGISGVLGLWEMPVLGAVYNTDEGDVTITAITEKDTISGAGNLYYSAPAAGTDFMIHDKASDLTGFTGTATLTNVRLKIRNQAQFGSANSVPTYVVNSGSQLWLYGGGAHLTGNVTLSGHGTNSKDASRMGALRFESDSSFSGSVTLADDATISSFYYNQGGAAKNLKATVDLAGHTLYLGCSPDYDPSSFAWEANSSYWFTDLTVSGKISGDGTLVIRNTKKIYLTNTENDFTGDIDVQVGTLAITNNAALGAGNLTVMNIGENGVFDYSGGDISNLKVTGNGKIYYHGTGSGASTINLHNTNKTYNASEFTGTIDVENTRLQVREQSQLGAGADADGNPQVTVNVKNGAQLWVLGNGTTNPITATFNIAGMGYNSGNDGQGAIRLEVSSSIAGVVNLMDDARFQRIIIRKLARVRT
ncbi:MAG: hypothetical protein Q4C70_10995 [Planctomycetia bacterium]|nr:hypothetical protein [Planctomycetia bacterium]